MTDRNGRKLDGAEKLVRGIGNLGDRFVGHADGQSISCQRSELQDPEQERQKAGRARNQAGRMWFWWTSTRRSLSASITRRLLRCRSDTTATF